MYNAIAIEDYGKPTVVLAARGFINDAESAASSRGIPGIRNVETSILNESTVMEDIEAGINASMDDIVAELTRPLSEEEMSPTPKEAEGPARIFFKGTLEEVNRFFYQRGWTDGLPVIPPTEEAVAEMLTGIDLPADHVVTRVIPRMGKATVEKIAINAVMAGALPTHMPVLIAGVQALMDPKTRFDIFEVSTGSWAPFLIVNGPIRNDILINCGSGAMSPGNIANAAIGRAIGLIVKNIGGARKGVEDMGVLGNPGKYSLVIGEYEEESPWEPLHVERGFKKEENTVTIFYPNSLTQTTARETNADGIVSSIASLGGGGMACFLVIPRHARVLASEGWTKQKVKDFILEKATASLSQQDPRRMMADPEGLIIFVAGGPGAFMGRLSSAGGAGMGNSFVTHRIELPANWDKLVAKYKNVVPTYARY